MIRYEIDTSIARSGMQAKGWRYVVSSIATDATDIDHQKSHHDMVAKEGVERYSRFQEKRSASTMLRSVTAESSSDSKLNRWSSESLTFNCQFFLEIGKVQLTAVDDVKRTADLVYSWEHDGYGRHASFYVVYFVEQKFRLRAYEQVNRLLAEVDVSSITEWSMIALLRSSFVARSFLPAWPKLLSSVRERLESQGKNADRLLRGLNR